MEQTKALNALEPFIALTKSASSPRAASDLITSATSAPNTYIFSPLLNSPQIQALSTSPEYGSHLRLLQIFTYGSYSDYVVNQASLPTLTPAQLHKLRLLTLLTLARTPGSLTYSSLLKTLSLPSKKDLEDLVITAIYANLLAGTLDPLHQTVLISSIAPIRDVAPATIPQMVATLKEWQGRCDDTLAELESQIRTIRSDAIRRAREEKEWKDKVEAMVTSAGSVSGASGQPGSDTQGQRNTINRVLNSNVQSMGRADAPKRGHGAQLEGDAEGMDIDEDDENSRAGPNSKGSKKRGYGH